MKTFESCNRVWLTMPEDGVCPSLPEKTEVRELQWLEAETGQYKHYVYFAAFADWVKSKGWYPVHADGTDDHGTAELFITNDRFTQRSPRKREIRRRFKLSTKRSILPS